MPLDPFNRLAPDRSEKIAFSSITSPPGPGGIISEDELGQYFHNRMIMVRTTADTVVVMIIAFFILIVIDFSCSTDSGLYTVSGI